MALRKAVGVAAETSGVPVGNSEGTGTLTPVQTRYLILASLVTALLIIAAALVWFATL